MQFLRFSRTIEDPACYDGQSHAGRSLTRQEAEVYDSALTILLEYFNRPLDPTIPVANGSTQSCCANKC